MDTTRRLLITRLQDRNADRNHATDGGIHPHKLITRVAPKDLLATERSLQFTLPDLVRDIYLQVGNGGFGPEYGIVGTKHGAKLDGHTLESCYHHMLTLDQEHIVWRWPQRLLPFSNFGCGMWACVDCTYKRLPMVLWDPNHLDTTLQSEDARLNWCHSFWDLGKSLAAWLDCWLSESPQSEPQRPTGAWIKKRLGITLLQ